MRHLMTSPRRRGERGAAAVEFALVLPLLLTLLFGIIAYGVVFAQSLSLSNAARQAARAAVIDGVTCSQVTSLARDNADTIAMKGTDLSAPDIKAGTSLGSATTTCASGGASPCKGQTPGTNVYVVLTYATSKSALQLPFVPVPATLTATGAFQCEL